MANHMRRDIAERARKIELLETIIRDFTSTAAGLAREIAAEEERTRIKDPNHVAYSTLAKAMATRRGKLLMSAAEAEVGLLATRCEVDEATVASHEVKKAAGAGSIMELDREEQGSQYYSRCIVMEVPSLQRTYDANVNTRQRTGDNARRLR